MNERIEALMIKASNGSCYDGPCGVQLSGDGIEKFAELIVLELTERLVTDTTLEYNEAIWIANYLKHHFGVEL